MHVTMLLRIYVIRKVWIGLNLSVTHYGIQHGKCTLIFISTAIKAMCYLYAHYTFIHLHFIHHLQKLQSFHMRCLRQILHVKWQDHIPDTEVLQMSNSRSIGSMLMESQLRWSGHITHMPDYRHSKHVFLENSALETGELSLSLFLFM